MIHGTINKKWFPGTIQLAKAEPNSYDVTSSEGNLQAQLQTPQTLPNMASKGY